MVFSSNSPSAVVLPCNTTAGLTVTSSSTLIFCILGVVSNVYTYFRTFFLLGSHLNDSDFSSRNLLIRFSNNSIKMMGNRNFWLGKGFGDTGDAFLRMTIWDGPSAIKQKVAMAFWWPSFSLAAVFPIPAHLWQRPLFGSTLDGTSWKF